MCRRKAHGPVPAPGGALASLRPPRCAGLLCAAPLELCGETSGRTTASGYVTRPQTQPPLLTETRVARPLASQAAASCGSACGCWVARRKGGGLKGPREVRSQVDPTKWVSLKAVELLLIKQLPAVFSGDNTMRAGNQIQRRLHKSPEPFLLNPGHGETRWLVPSLFHTCPSPPSPFCGGGGKRAKPCRRSASPPPWALLPPSGPLHSPSSPSFCLSLWLSVGSWVTFVFIISHVPKCALWNT